MVAAVCSILAAGVFADDLASRFAAPPESCRLQTWFHWNADCVTKEGIVADLKSMKEMDIGVAHVFVPQMANLPRTARKITLNPAVGS